MACHHFSPLLLLVAVAGTAPVITYTACTEQADVGKGGCLAEDEAGIDIAPLRTVCVQNLVLPPGGCALPSCTKEYGVPICSDVCDIKRTIEDYQISKIVPGGATGYTPYAAEKNAAFQLMVQGVRAGNNANIKCAGAPNWWKLTNHDWCHPGKPCNAARSKSTLAVMDDCTVDSDPTQCRGRCVVDPSGFGGRVCHDMCDKKMTPKEYGEGARAGVEQEVELARYDGTCSSHSTGFWFVITLLVIILVVGCIVGVGFLIRSRMGRGKPRGRHGGFDPVLDVPGHGMPDVPPMDHMPPMQQMAYQEDYQQPRSPPPQQQERMMQPPAPRTPSNPGNFFGLGEPNLVIPSLAPPPQSFSQVPAMQEYAVSMGQPHPQQPSYSSYGQQQGYTTGQPRMAYGQPPSTQGYVMAPSMTTQPPAAFQTQQGFQFHR